MSSLEEQVYQHLETNKELIPVYVAPKFSDKIWSHRQNKKTTFYLCSLACSCLLLLMLWVPSKINNSDTHYLIAQNQALEVRLAQVSFITLTENQQRTMANWYAELELIDQNMEQHSGEDNPNLWPNRARLLTQMIDFYLHPFEIYEI